MKRLGKLAAILLTAGFVAGLAGCPVTGDDGGGGGGGDGGAYAEYYEGTFRNNQNGTTEVVNNTGSDMLLFTGEVIGKAFIVGGVKSGTRANVNFSSESDWTVGGYKLLRAVKQTEFEKAGDQSRVDHTAMVTDGEGKRFTTSITSTTDGDYQYQVYNRSRDYGLELRENSPEGRKVAYLTKGEVRRFIRTPNSDMLTLFPVWVAFNNQSKSIVTFTPSDVLSSLDIQPKRTNEEVSPYYFPVDGTNVNIQFPNITLPFAAVNVRNNGQLVANFRIANTIKTPQSGYSGITSGARESYEVPSDGEPLNLNLAMSQGNTVVNVRFEDKPGEDAVLKNGYLYTVTLTLKTGGNPG
ncbi:MAG: hypothetical protein FWD94_01375, partial [Treponema sp.]|nr:hypothetical protein [Treponema sp.]